MHRRCLRRGLDDHGLGNRRLGVEHQNHRGHRPGLGVRPGPDLGPGLGAEHPDEGGHRHPDLGAEHPDEERLDVAPEGVEYYRGSGACPSLGSTQTGCYPGAVGEESPSPGSSRTDCCLGVEPALSRHQASQLASPEREASEHRASPRQRELLQQQGPREQQVLELMVSRQA